MDIDQKQKKAALNLYIMLGISLASSLIPMISVALISLMFVTFALGMGYSAAKKSEPESFLHNHARFTIRTIWISGFLALVTTTIAGCIVIGQIDNSSFDVCTNSLMNQSVKWMERAGFADIYPLIEPCVNDFVATNHSALLVAAIVAGGPIAGYMGWRLYKGARAAMRSEKMADVTSWF